MAGSLFPAACFRDLIICDPFCGWMSCDAKPQNMSSAVPHDQKSSWSVPVEMVDLVERNVPTVTGEPPELSCKQRGLED
jgi:hypothetical protein